MLTSGQPPFADDNKDEFLKAEMLMGKRPNVIERTPECYKELMERCWNSDPLKRPSAIELYKTIKRWYLGKNYNQFKKADQFSLLKNKKPEVNQTDDKSIVYNRG